MRLHLGHRNQPEFAFKITRLSLFVNPRRPLSAFAGLRSSPFAVQPPPKIVAIKSDILAVGHPKLPRHAVIIAAAAQPIGPHIMQPLANFASCHVITPVNTSRSLCICIPCGCFRMFCPNAPLRRRRGRGSKLPPFPPPGPGRSAAEKDFC